MAGQPVTGTITGIPNAPTVNVRAGPGTTFQTILQLPKNITGLRVVDVQPDASNSNLNGKIYQWFRLVLPDGASQGWVRDDLLAVTGDATRLGYPIFTAPTIPFYITRQTVAQPVQPVAVQPVAVQPVQTVQPVQPVQAVQPAQTAVQPIEAGAVQPVHVQPAAGQAVVVEPATPAQPVVTAVLTPPAAVCMLKGGGNVRSGAAAGYNPPLGRLNYKESVTVLGFKPDEGNGWLNWIKISYQGREGWMREDLLRLSGKLGDVGLPADLYPSPLQDTWWVRDFDPDGTKLNNKHAGWDQSGAKGAPLTAGPKGAFVHKAAFCKSCGTEGSSSLEKGFTLMDSRVWNDQNWNFGYGHYIILRYDHDKLPASTQQWLAANKMAGFHAFAMYAHLNAMLVSTGETVAPGQTFAKLGNSGNSEAPHLHLELRFASDPNAQWAAISKGLASPKQLFFR